ncbi:MAG: D-alanyl-D-alanine carboxypeptidase/D-alanyl-D-alanine-endopeptidase [Deltaproteobacteria bacterium]|nr:D-alanyl-D-alanine carboxypeptidase/D-alanyl-D-alanine-endopeptidase [Deltaproteobacteria bacterium]
MRHFFVGVRRLGTWALLGIATACAHPAPLQVPFVVPSPVTPPAPAPAPAVSSPLTDDEPLGQGLAPKPGALPVLVPPPLDGAARAKWLATSLDGLFGGPGHLPPPLGAGKVSVLVVDHESGRVVYGRDARLGLNAASNVKLMTAAAALSLLGPEYRFRTVVYGPQRTAGRYLEAGGELVGDVHLRGGGDPTLVDADLSDLANQLWALGVRKIKGNLVVDATFFDEQTVPPAYEQKEESGAFRAPSSAVSLNSNALGVTVIPASQAGTVAKVLVTPESPYVQLTGKILTAGKGPAWPVIETSEAPADGANSVHGRTLVAVSGRVAVGQQPRTFYRRVVNPALYAGYTTAAIFAQRGIVLAGQVKLGATPQGQRLLATHVSEPLGVLVHELNKRSNNFAAEQLVRTLGAQIIGTPGNWDKGLEAIARYLEGVGIRRGTYRMENGAGLYDSNRFSAEQITMVVRAALRDFRIAGEFAASLSLAGIDGTLGPRMAGTAAERYVRAKTGTLLAASCLSGMAGSPTRGPLVFSFLMNDVTDMALARAAQDQGAAVLAWYLNPERPVQTSPPTAVAAPSN